MSHNYNHLHLLDDAANGNGADCNGYCIGAMTAHFYSSTGSWDSATAKVQVSPDGTIWYDVTGASATADGYVNFACSAPHVRGVVSGGLGAESVSILLRHRLSEAS